MLGYLMRGLLLGGAAAAQPGPFQAYLLSQTLSYGWRHALLATFAPLFSDGPIIALVLFLLTRMPEGFLSALQVLGGLFLLYLARGAFKKVGELTGPSAGPSETGRRGLLQAVLMNALSPNPYIFWATVAGPILIEGWRLSPGSGVSFVAGFYVTLVGGFMAFVGLFATAGRLDPRVSRILSVVSALLLFLFGLYQLGSGLWSLSGRA